MAQLKDLVVTGDSRIVGNTYINGTVYCTKTTDAAGGADNRPALITGTVTGEHIEFDGNEIMAKTASTTAGTLGLNSDGGDVNINGKRVSLVYSGTAAPATSTGKDGDIYVQYSA